MPRVSRARSIREFTTRENGRSGLGRWIAHTSRTKLRDFHLLMKSTLMTSPASRRSMRSRIPPLGRKNVGTSAREIARQASWKIREKAGLVSISVRKFAGAVSQRGGVSRNRQISWRVSRHEPHRIDGSELLRSTRGDGDRACRASSTSWQVDRPIDESFGESPQVLPRHAIAFSSARDTLIQNYKKLRGTRFFLHLSRVDYTTAFTDCITVYSNRHTGRSGERLPRSLRFTHDSRRPASNARR